MDPYSTIPHPGHVTGHQRGGGDTPTTIQFLTTRYMKVILASISCEPNLSTQKYSDLDSIRFKIYFDLFSIQNRLESYGACSQYVLLS